MRDQCCCHDGSDGAIERPSWIRATRRAIRWIVPGVVLAAMPKCPICLAAYVALFTGFGISLAAAKFAWWAVAIGCVAALVYLATATVRGFLRSG
jgi:hypothetical protein